MKVFGKRNLGLHVHPIYLNIAMVMAAGMLVAMALVAIGFIIFH